MNTLIKWPFSNDVFPNMKTLLKEFWTDTPDFFNRMLHTGTTLPAANFKESEKAYEIELAVPGVKKEDLKIQINQDRLTVSSETNTETTAKEDNYTCREYSFSAFSRSFILPEDANRDAVGADYRDGVLHLNVPKVEGVSVKGSREISIQ